MHYQDIVLKRTKTAFKSTKILKEYKHTTRDTKRVKSRLNVPYCVSCFRATKKHSFLSAFFVNRFVLTIQTESQTENK